MAARALNNLGVVIDAVDMRREQAAVPTKPCESRALR